MTNPQTPRKGSSDPHWGSFIVGWHYSTKIRMDPIGTINKKLKLGPDSTTQNFVLILYRTLEDTVQ